MHPTINIALRAAREAADLIVQVHARPDRRKVFEKGPNDFVTDTDTDVENLLIAAIRKTYPDHSFLCEESGYLEGKDKDTVWIIDPIDGTRNFVMGIPHFCISIACVVKNKVQHALIVDPVRNEEFTASKGSGAQLNGNRIRVGSCGKLEQAVVSLSCAGLKQYKQQLDLQTRLEGKISALRLSGSTALDMAYVAAGRVDIGWMSGGSKWDTAAGNLLVQEAGGLVSDFKGNPDCLESDNLVFANPKCFRQFLPHTAEL